MDEGRVQGILQSKRIQLQENPFLPHIFARSVRMTFETLSRYLLDSFSNLTMFYFGFVHEETKVTFCSRCGEVKSSKKKLIAIFVKIHSVMSSFVHKSSRGIRSEGLC